MPNPNQPTISLGATGDAVRRLQRALRRTPNLGLVVDGVFGAAVDAAVKEFQQGAGLAVDGMVGPLTWAALPSGAPMPTLRAGATGAVVRSLQQILANGASGQWNTSPGAIDGNFARTPRPRFKPFRLGAGSPRMALLVIKRGPSRCMQQARRWRPRSVSIMRLDSTAPINDACFEPAPVTSNFDPLRTYAESQSRQGSESADLILANPLCCHRD
jgi:putative peptidoglycan binding protein